MPSPSRRVLSHRTVVRAAAVCTALLVASGCGGGEPGSGADTPAPASDASGGAPSSSAATAVPGGPAQQPSLPADPSGYTVAYVQETLAALFQDYETAVVAYQASGAVDDTVRAALADVYHPEVYDQQIRNLEDYFPGGENLEDPPGAVLVEVTGLHSVSTDCILAITTYDIGAVTTLDAPAEDDFFIGLARNADDADGTRPWLITVEYGTSDGEPLSGDVCL